MCYHSQRTAALAEREHEAEGASRERTAARTDDRDAPADPDDFVEIEAVTERVGDDADATGREEPDRTEAKPKPVGFA